MQLSMESGKAPNDYLEESTYIDWQHEAVLSCAKKIVEPCEGVHAVAQACFEFVRDEIKHSWDYKLDPVTCKASDVLLHGTGYCYAKSHLLAALLRANGIPTGLCYQRLTIEGDVPPFCLHGLNAIFLEGQGWYRIDARGNRVDVNAQFNPPLEQLAFPVKVPGETDFEMIWRRPLPVVVDCLENSESYRDVARNLPDLCN